jgi:hypothetical protein
VHDDTHASTRRAPLGSYNTLTRTVSRSPPLRLQVNELAAEWLSPLAVEVFRAELLARSASPAVEAQLQVCALLCVCMCVCD